MASFGNFAVVLATLCAAWTVWAALAGARTRRDHLVRSGQGALVAAALSLTAAATALVVSLLAHDFRVVYVIEHTNRSMSTMDTVGAFWAGQQGSLLLWAWLAALCGFAVVYTLRGEAGESNGYLVGTIGAVVFLFASLILFTANPFDQLPSAMPDGQGLNPLLRNYGQWVHPPTLYIGFVALTVPFAYAVAALASGRADNWWLPIAYRWTMLAWMFLTAGIVLGMRWAYVELGWGGYWAWDPVENASLLPWLTATAFLHTSRLQIHKGMLRTWNPILVVTTFALSLLGTFLTRSGVVSSVHAFGSSGLGPFLLAGVVASVVVGGGLIVWRLPYLRANTANTSNTSIWSGAALLTLANVVLLAITAVVLWGTIYPLFSQAASGTQASVGPTFYHTLVVPLSLLLLALMAAYPIVDRIRDGEAWLRAIRTPALAGALAVAGTVAVGRGQHLLACLIAGLAATTMVAVAERPVLAAWSHWRRGTPALRRARYGAVLVHIGIAVFIASIAAHVALRTQNQATLDVGESMRVGQYSVRLANLADRAEADTARTVATLEIRQTSNGALIGTVHSELISTAAQSQPVVEVAIQSTVVEDVYLAVQRADTAGRTAQIAGYVNPAVSGVWAGAVLVIIGSIIAAWPARWGRRRKDEPAGEAGLPATTVKV